MPQPTHHKAWQRHWHDVFDAALGPDDKEPPENVDEDLRLQFEFASLDAEARRRAFSVFPRHEEMLARLQQYQSTPARAIGPDEAVQLLRDGLALVEPMGLDVPDADGKAVTWRITARTGAVNARREGWRPQDFVGKRVTVEGNPSRRPDGKAMTAGVVTFQDGKVVCLGGCPGGPPIE